MKSEAYFNGGLRTCVKHLEHRRSHVDLSRGMRPRTGKIACQVSSGQTQARESKYEDEVDVGEVAVVDLVHVSLCPIVIISAVGRCGLSEK